MAYCVAMTTSPYHHQVLDYSREDWWLVIPMAVTEEESRSEPLKEGWVPANHLEKLISGKCYQEFIIKEGRESV